MTSTEPCPAAAALLTDLYQFTMVTAYQALGMERQAVFEFFVRGMPPGRGFLLATGLQQALEYLQGPLSTVKGHTRIIFDNLQVQRRTEAVARARELGLL